jgi:hypothetical protein
MKLWDGHAPRVGIHDFLCQSFLSRSFAVDEVDAFWGLPEFAHPRDQVGLIAVGRKALHQVNFGANGQVAAVDFEFLGAL